MIEPIQFDVSWYQWDDAAHGWLMASRIVTAAEKQELVEELSAAGCRAKIERLPAAPARPHDRAFKGTYTCINDDNVQMPGGRLGLSFASNDELVLTNADGSKVAWKRVK